jgi:hypothetical protein
MFGICCCKCINIAIPAITVDRGVQQTRDNSRTVEMHNYTTTPNNTPLLQRRPIIRQQTPSLTSDLISIPWEIAKNEIGQYMIQSRAIQLNNRVTQAIYHPHTNTITDLEDKILRNVTKPAEHLLQKLHDKIYNSNGTPTHTDQNGIIRYTQHPHIIYNPKTKNWLDTTENTVLHGLPPPSPPPPSYSTSAPQYPPLS